MAPALPSTSCFAYRSPSNSPTASDETVEPFLLGDVMNSLLRTLTCNAEQLRTLDQLGCVQREAFFLLSPITRKPTQLKHYILKGELSTLSERVSDHNEIMINSAQLSRFENTYCRQPLIATSA